MSWQKTKPEGLKVFCVHQAMAQSDGSTATALYDIAWKRTSSQKGHELLQGFHNAGFPPMSLELYAENQTLSQCYATTGPAQVTAGAFLNTINPYIEVREIPDYMDRIAEEGAFAVGEFDYGNWDIYPSIDYGPVAVAPMQNILQAMSQVPPQFKILVQFSMKFTYATFRLHSYLWFWRQVDRIAYYLRPKYWFKKGVRERQLEFIIDKTQRKWTISNLRITIALEGADAAKRSHELKSELRRHLDTVLIGFAMANDPDLNWYKFRSVKFGRQHLEDVRIRKVGYWRPAIPITLREIAGWWTITFQAALNFTRIFNRQLPPPMDLPSPEFEQDRKSISVIGNTLWREQKMPFGILRSDRNRHIFVLGTAGTGKSHLLQLLMREDIRHGYGCGLIDPTGSMTNEILQLIPENRIDDVIIFDPTDVAFPASLNPFELVDDQSRMRVASGLIEMFRIRFSEIWSDKLEHLLLFTVLALLSTQWTTVLAIRKMLLDPIYRSSLIPNIKDEVVREFWQNQFPTWLETHRKDAIEPLLQMVGDFVANEMLRNSLGQPFNKFDFRDIIDSRKILLMKLAKKDLGADAASLVGAMVMTRIYQAAMSRADTPFEKREDFYLYIDAFDEFATASFEEILSESRKYKLNLTLSNQNLSLLPTSVRNTIFGNVGTLISFRTSAEDAGMLVQEFRPKVDSSDLMNLQPRNFYMKMTARSKIQRVFSARTHDLHIPQQNFSEACIEASRDKYCLPKAQAVEIINKWSQVG
ncbi:MAG: type IV secretion system DNA-binding domain-containing protein [Bdellovibrionales bacterium]|nr:type IV secretion system DNA-binding domain-containing protein [Bdellovibrionales bacterium]